MAETRGSTKSYFTVVGSGAVLLSVAAAVYARMKAVPAAIALPLVVAFLIEFPFYLLPGFAAARDRFMARGKPRAAALLALSALAPWSVYAISTGHFNPAALVLLCSIAVLTSFWYVVFPANAVVDLLYLCLFAAIVLLKVFARIYPAPVPKLDVSILGHVMLVRMMAMSMTAIRGGVDAEYRFWPSRTEWFAGLRWFAWLLPPVVAAYWALGLLRLRPHPMNIFLVAGTFFGILWVTAISEEFLFRGLLQPWLSKWTSSPVAGLILSSLLFGSVHLGFHGPFPNWRFSTVAAILGFFCGLARRKTGGIQAGMVAHSLLVAVWRMFLQ